MYNTFNLHNRLNNSWKDYLGLICTETRKAYFNCAAPYQAEKATFKNIIFDCK